MSWGREEEAFVRQEVLAQTQWRVLNTGGRCNRQFGGEVCLILFKFRPLISNRWSGPLTVKHSSFTNSPEKVGLALFPTIWALFSVWYVAFLLSQRQAKNNLILSSAHSHIRLISLTMSLRQIHRCQKFTKCKLLVYNKWLRNITAKNIKFTRNTTTMRETVMKSCLTSTAALCLISCLLSQPEVVIFRAIPSSSRQQIHSITQGDPSSLCWPITAFKKPAAPGKLWLLEIKTNLGEKHCSY